MAEGKGKGLERSLVSTTGLVVLLVALVFVNVILSYANVRWDVTEDKVYSLSDGTRAILRNLEEPVTLRLFYNSSKKNIPFPLKNYHRRVVDYLREYEHASDGMVILEQVDPKPDTDEEEWALKYGLDRVSVQGGETMFFGLVAVSTDMEESISFLDPSREQFLEYELSRAILGVQTPYKKVVGIMSTLPVFGGPGGRMAMMQQQQQQQEEEPWYFVTELKQLYDVRKIDNNAGEIGEDVDLLMIVQPANLGPGAAKAVDAYIRNGGKVVIFQDPDSVWSNQTQQNRMRPQKPTSLNELYEAWGIRMDVSRGVADLEQATMLQTQNMREEENAMWVSVQADRLNSDDMITGELESMLMPVAGAIEKKEGFAADLEWTPLIRSSRQAALTDTFRANIGANAIRAELEPGDEPLTMGARIQGRFPSAFPGEDGAETGAKPATVVIVGDTDLLYDSYYMRKIRGTSGILPLMFNDNLNFVLNTTELLTGSAELISIRSRGKFGRPFTRVQELASQAQEKWLDKEQELMEKLEETRQKLSRLEQAKSSDQQLIMSPEQRGELERYRDERARINKELKEVRRKLRADIEDLGTKIKFLNILLMPLLVSLAGVGYGLYRYTKSRRG
ncbi:MAG: Gldg family protein [Desulfatibacillaceae bacterium]